MCRHTRITCIEQCTYTLSRIAIYGRVTRARQAISGPSEVEKDQPQTLKMGMFRRPGGKTEPFNTTWATRIFSTPSDTRNCQPTGSGISERTRCDSRHLFGQTLSDRIEANGRFAPEAAIGDPARFTLQVLYLVVATIKSNPPKGGDGKHGSSLPPRSHGRPPEGP